MQQPHPRLRCNSRQTLRDRGICVLIPTYNNDATLRSVVEDVLCYCADVIVVNDGSTDNTQSILDEIEGITVVNYPKNRGKGYALKKGFQKALAMGFAYAITLDSDGQHYANEIPQFLKANQEYPHSIIVGARRLEGVVRSAGTRFANRFSNFWFHVQTGCGLPDTQSGYRLYPLKRLVGLGILTSRYEAELTLMVLASWHGVAIKSIPIDVYYPPRDERVSHFRPLRDFARISILNTVLCVLAVIYGLPRRALSYLMRIVRTVRLYALVLLVLSVATPLVWLYLKMGKVTKRTVTAKAGVRQLIFRCMRFLTIQHGIPGVRLTQDVAGDADFDNPHIIICNHQSALDLVCLLSISPKIVFMTNERVYGNPLYGFIIRSAEYLRAVKGLDELMPEMESLVARGYSIAIFPEGTRSKDLSIGKFHSGAFYFAEEMNLDLLPVVVYGTGMVLPKHARLLRKGRIHVRVDSPVRRSELASMPDIREQVSFFREYYRRRYSEIKNSIDQDL